MALRRPVAALHAPDERHPPLVDPRDGDIEADASSTESRSLLAIAGNLLVEVSLPKFAAAFFLLVVVPALLLGITPLLATVWWNKVSANGVRGIGALAFLAFLLAVGWFGGKKLFRLVESAFWSLNAMAIQPAYVTFREGLLHLGGRLTSDAATETKEIRVRVAAKILAALLLCALALVVVWLVWPHTRWSAVLGDLKVPHRLIVPALANATAVAAAYLAASALVWGITDVAMPQPRLVTRFRAREELVRTWRVAHLSDIHVVGERFGFRLGSGRAGPRGNDNFLTALRRLDEVHRREPLDAIVITGDLTDAGTSAEFGELLETLEAFPRLAELMIAMPGNHDVNIVDRANPARLDLPTSPKKRLRQVRTLSTLAAMQGEHTRVVDLEQRRVTDTLDDALAPYGDNVRAFAEEGSRRRAKATDAAWIKAFPMVIAPESEDGLGIIALNSNAETHFSFTNALGLVPRGEVQALDKAMAQYPRAAWIIALHHHIVEHPKLGHALAERIGTTLINGNWFTRHLLGVGRRALVMHGHRHIDWMGECGDLLILSASSSTMPSKGHEDVYFYVHTVGVDASGRIGIAQPQRVDVV
ncbi:MAG TPA: metallophosphoesterase [Gemmatimonadaceae bacterium]